MRGLKYAWLNLVKLSSLVCNILGSWSRTNVETWLCQGLEKLHS